MKELRVNVRCRIKSDGNKQRKIRLSGGTMNEKKAGSAKLGGYKERAKKETGI